MRRRGVKNPDVAAIADTLPATVSKWRGGAQRPDEDVIDRIAGFLGVPYLWLSRGGEPLATSDVVEIPTEAMALVYDMLATLARRGVSANEIERARARLLSPQYVAWYAKSPFGDSVDERIVGGLRAVVREELAKYDAPPSTGLPREPERAAGETEDQHRPRAVGEARGDPASRTANRRAKGDTPRDER
jgi:transcriptional regulator with XRE-family HTH domain